jgi:hypothetical protein
MMSTRQFAHLSQLSPDGVNTYNTILIKVSVLLMLVIFISSVSAMSKEKHPSLKSVSTNGSLDDGEMPNLKYVLHDVGKLATLVYNNGFISTSFPEVNISGCEYPVNSNLRYLRQCSFWIGGITDVDTLVSAVSYIGTRELLPDPGESGEIIQRSINWASPYRHDDAVSEQDFICTFTDTTTAVEWTSQDQFDNRLHIPLGLRITQRSYAWGIGYTEDFILINYTLENIADHDIREMFLGITVQGATSHPARSTTWDGDEICGFMKIPIDSLASCEPEDSLYIVWCADNDGDPNDDREYDFASPVAVAGIQLVDFPEECTTLNYNWWVEPYWIIGQEFAPRQAPTDDDPWRVLGNGLYWPQGDRNKYYQLSHPEVDYDPIQTFNSHVDDGFLNPPHFQTAWDIADGAMFLNLISFGPIDLAPGDTTSFTIAVVMGDDFHTDPNNFRDYFEPRNPQVFLNRLDFSNLIANARFAKWVYDNPGYDTDGDGNAGKYCWRYSMADTTDNGIPDSVVVDSFKYYYTGDGVSDFRTILAPPVPVIRVHPEYGRVTIRWNGKVTETTPDNLSGEVDFEGYRVYLAEDDRLADFVLLSDYDIDDYIVYEFDVRNTTWRVISRSAGIDSLRQVHGTNFNPLDYDNAMNYFLDSRTGQILYFQKQGWNQSDLINPLGIHKPYPDAKREDLFDTTEAGDHRHYEYEYIADNLAPSKAYYFAVTAYDYGASQYDVGALETSPLANAVKTYALPSSEMVEEKGLGVIVYPNPYRIDGGYARAGYENRDRTKSAAWSRRIHFANLPSICTIRIFTIDGDLVREIKHYNPGGSPESQHEEWNVISRNTQAVVTGIYIWSVRSEMGEQLGKLVIIK